MTFLYTSLDTYMQFSKHLLNLHLYQHHYKITYNYYSSKIFVLLLLSYRQHKIFSSAKAFYFSSKPLSSTLEMFSALLAPSTFLLVLIFISVQVLYTCGYDKVIKYFLRSNNSFHEYLYILIISIHFELISIFPFDNLIASKTFSCLYLCVKLKNMKKLESFDIKISQSSKKSKS